MLYKTTAIAVLFFLSLSGGYAQEKNEQRQDSVRTIQTNRLKEKINWIHPENIKLYLADIKNVQGVDAKKWEEQLSLLEQELKKTETFITEESFTDEQLGQAEALLQLHREIMLANPLIDNTPLIFTRYHLGRRATRAMGPNLGTSPANYSSLFSGSRRGYDAELVKLSDIRHTTEEEIIYKPTLDVPISDVQIHWDADRILFSSLDQDRKWQVYEVNSDGSNLHKKIVTEEDDLEFCDANYLPDGKVVATTNIGYNGVPCVNGEDIVANMISYDPKTQMLDRLTYDQDGNWCPIVMPNGRIMYTRWEYTDLTHYYSRIVMHMNPDGTENKALYGSGSYFPNSTFDMKPLPNSASRFIGIITGHHGVSRSGRLIIFDPAKSRKEEKGMIQELPFRNRPIVPIIKDELVNDVWPQFMKPYPLNEKYFLVACKLSPDALWGIYLVDIFDNLTLIAEAEGQGLTAPIPVRKTKTPPVIPSKVKPNEKEATFFIQDIYEGEGSVGIPKGTIKALRIFAYEYAYIKSPSDHDAQGIQSGWDIKRILGTVPVEEDGSAIFTAPANTPISIQPLDKDGAAVQWMRSWVTGRPGEIVSCIGCHEDHNMMPIPKRSIAAARSPRKLNIPEGGVRPFTFPLEVQPLLDRNCISCHDGTTDIPDFRAGEKVLYKRGVVTKIERFYDKSYLNLHPYVYRQGPEADMYVLKPYEYHPSNSELIRILQQGHHNVELTDKEWQTLYAWIDLNVPYYGAFTQLQEWNGIDQVKRRRELSKKYSNIDVDWQQEIEDYAKWLKENGNPAQKTVQPPVAPRKIKEAKAKGFPFDAATAKEIQQKSSNTLSRQLEIAPGVSVTFVWVPAGSFVMGNNNDPSASPAFQASVKKGFWMSTTEITNQQYRAIFPEHDSRYIGQTWKDHTTPGYPVNEPQQPVVRVSWEEANAFCEKVSENTQYKVFLPTETQWEWAARAGSANDFWYGGRESNFSTYENLADSMLVDLAVTGVNPRPMRPNDPMREFWDYQPKVLTANDGQLVSAPVAGYAPNPWGLYDMYGNVAEWTRSAYMSYPLQTKSKAASEEKIVRGGSWIERPQYSTSSYRKKYLPWQKPFNVGFRIIIEE
ncbi:SUMF1/EgtB/PvdO family nonheme iron enzyme [Parabacteroides sp. OttesenSCG-928-G06]|nr:SUMF1/EgtB/PvdO family nonheme iron enzyme [Parabacteroides sp. OttesenSCG-928-K15]MDL2282104.1 SUMF1/EgtB/PvdO family nonheme iron enzyme [Parabacteroides sp. OttesenSCG-928-G06]